MSTFNIENRLVSLASSIILFTNSIPQNIAGKNLINQMTRSSTSAALNFGEFQAGESLKDKIHKLGIVLKELKETRVALKVILKVQYGNQTMAKEIYSEVEEVIAIIASIIIKKRNLVKK